MKYGSYPDSEQFFNIEAYGKILKNIYLRVFLDTPYPNHTVPGHTVPIFNSLYFCGFQHVNPSISALINFLVYILLYTKNKLSKVDVSLREKRE